MYIGGFTTWERFNTEPSVVGPFIFPMYSNATGPGYTGHAVAGGVIDEEAVGSTSPAIRITPDGVYLDTASGSSSRTLMVHVKFRAYNA